MIIRKLFEFENAHVVRNCSSERCKHSIHGHSYKVEVKLIANALDNGHMVYDFGLMKNQIKQLIDSFDHATTIWAKDNPEYVSAMMKHSARYVLLPVSPSAEQFARVIFKLVDATLRNTIKANEESPDLSVYSVTVHETRTGSAEAFITDVNNPRMGLFEINEIIFSEAIKSEWSDYEMFSKLKTGYEQFINTKPVQQVKQKSFLTEKMS